MVAGFRRSLSFSTTPSPKRTPPPEKSYHVRSISLPCKSHPILSQLKDKINDLRKWESQLELASNEASSSSAHLCQGLSLLKDVHYCLDDLLHLPQTQESLRGRSEWIENLLDDFLHFVDVYDIFRTTLFSLKEAQSSAQVSLRRRNESNIASYVKACSKNDKELRKLASIVRCIGKCSSRPALNLVNSTDAELASVLSDVTQVTVSVSLALFHGISSSLSLSLSSSSSSSFSSGSCMMMGWRTQKPKKEKGILEFQEARLQSLRWLTKKVDQEEERMSLCGRLQVLDDCIGRIESGSEKVFRSLMNTRVSLLNVLTQ